MRSVLVTGVSAGLLLAGCGEKVPSLPTDTVDKAATCGVIAAASEREKAGVKGDLPAEAQERIFHYALLAGAEGGAFDAERANAVFKRMPELFEKTVEGKWQTLKPACDTAYPETKLAEPKLPEKPLDSMLQCYVLTDFLRKAFGGQGAAYNEASVKLGAFNTKLDAKVSPALKRAGIDGGDALQARRNAALAAAARLGQPQAVVAACEAKYE